MIEKILLVIIMAGMVSLLGSLELACVAKLENCFLTRLTTLQLCGT